MGPDSKGGSVRRQRCRTARQPFFEDSGPPGDPGYDGHVLASNGCSSLRKLKPAAQRACTVTVDTIKVSLPAEEPFLGVRLQRDIFIYATK